MANLLSVYEAMKAMEKTAEYNEQQRQADPTEEIITKYAELADDLLYQEFGNDYNENDVVKLAEMMIENDAAIVEETEKVAELRQAGQIMAEEFIETLERYGY